MILFTNLTNVVIDDKNYNPIPVLKLTTGGEVKIDQLINTRLSLLKKEAEINGFRVLINDRFLV
jgi:hypothetical protein